jgi:hypothetical protein
VVAEAKLRRMRSIHDQRSRDSDDDYISASDLAQLGFCERFVVLSARHGRQDPPDVSAARQRGTRAHDAFYEESRAIAQGPRPGGRRPCFLAQRVFQPGSRELAVLRQLRDEWLSRSVPGRWVVAAYDRISSALMSPPGGPSEWLVALARVGLVPIVGAATIYLDDHALEDPRDE